MICSITEHISGGELQLRVQHQHVFRTDKPVLKSTGEPQTEGEALASQGISSMGVPVLCFKTFLLDPRSEVICCFPELRVLFQISFYLPILFFSSRDVQKMAFSL